MYLPKASSCEGCPYYTKGDYYVPDHLVPNSEVMLIAQAPGSNEESGHALLKRHWLSQGTYHDEFTNVPAQPLIGPTGQQLNRQYLPLAKLQRSEVSVGNAIRCRPGVALGLKADELPTITNKMSLETSKADIVRAVRHCKSAHLVIPPSVKTVVAMGSLALYSLTGISSATQWRGYVVRTNREDICNHHIIDTTRYHDITLPVTNQEIDIYVMLHLAGLHKTDDKKYHHAMLHDFSKLRLYREKKWPLALPTWSSIAPKVWPAYSAFDTEYVPETNQLIRWSLCSMQNDLYCVEALQDGVQRIPIQPGGTIIVQNALADINHLATLIDLKQVTIEDLMLAHAMLYTGEPHSLNYIASMYGAFNRYKHLIDSDDLRIAQMYSALDAYEPLYIWIQHMIPQFRADKQCYAAYKRFTLPLIDIINKAQQKGIALNGTRLSEVQTIYQERINVLQAEARLLTGDSAISLGGLKRMKEVIYNET